MSNFEYDNMPPPLIVFLIPGAALFFLIQILLCEAYHFHVTIAKHKNYAKPASPSKRTEDKKNKNNSKHQAVDSDSKVPKSRKNGDPGDPKDNMKAKQVEFPEDGDGLASINMYEPDSVSTSYPEDPKENRLKARRKSVFAESYDPSKDEDDIKIVNPKTEEEKQWLMDNLNNVTLFQHLAKDQTTTVIDAMYKNEVKKGDVIMKQGDKGSTFYVIQTGVFNVYKKDPAGNSEKLMHTYNNEGSFGELALLYNQPRAATIIAVSDGILWAVDGLTFRRIIHKITHQKRMMYESLIKNVPMLQALEPYERANLVDALVPLTFQHDEEILREGDEGDGMYFIISGGVRIVVMTEANKSLLIKELTNSEYFGELALVTNRPRAASAFAVGETHLAFLDREAFERLLGPCMEIMKRNIDGYRERMATLLKEDGISL